MPSGPRSSLTSLPGRGVAEDEVEIGFVSGVFGVRGEVRLHLHSREDSVLMDGAPWQVVLIGPRGERRGTTVRARSGAGRRVLGRLDGVGDREQALSYKDWRLALAAASLPALDEGEFWVRDVEGLPVFVGGRRVGVIAAVHQAGPVDVFAVDTGADEVLVPALDEFVESLDLEGGALVLRDVAWEQED